MFNQTEITCFYALLAGMISPLLSIIWVYWLAREKRRVDVMLYQHYYILACAFLSGALIGLGKAHEYLTASGYIIAAN